MSHKQCNMLDMELHALDSAVDERDIVYLDSCASKNLFIVLDETDLESFKIIEGSIQLTKKGSQLRSLGVGKKGDWSNITVSHDAIKNIVSAGKLREHGYGLSLLKEPALVNLETGETAIKCSYKLSNGMPCCALSDVYNLPDLSGMNNLICNYCTVMHTETQTPIGALGLLHKRTFHTSKGKLVEGYKRAAFEGSGLDRSHCSKAAQQNCKKQDCSTCGRAKITRAVFKSRDEYPAHSFLELVTADISCYVNCESREGYKYVLCFTDIATKMFWEYPLKTRTAPEVFACLKHLCEVALLVYPGEHRWQKYHADGGAELITDQVKDYLRGKHGTVTTWTSTDTPEQNAVSERKWRTLGDMTLAGLIDSGLTTSYWWDAYKAACYVAKRLPTNTCLGWMSPMEAVPGGKVPNLRWLRTWGCKCYVLKPKADRRKDWEEKGMIGHFLGYSEDKQGWLCYLPEYDKFVTSVHILFDENIPARNADYFAAFDASIVKINPDEHAVSDYTYLVGTHHIDEGMLYVVTRVITRKGYIVAYRALITGGRAMLEDKQSIHVADVVVMWKEYVAPPISTVPRDTESSSPPAPSIAAGLEEEGLGGSTPMAGAGVVSEEVPTPTIPGEAGARRSSRQPVQRQLANVHKLGELHHIDLPNLEHFLNAQPEGNIMGHIHYTEDVDELVEPTTHDEALDSPQRAEWRGARRSERDALHKREVMEVVSIPAGAEILKSRYVYKIKRDEFGKVKKYKARLVVLGCGQTQNMEKVNTFAPVVKGVTIKLILAIAQTYHMHVHQLDVSNAFCYADIEGGVYMKAPPDIALPPGMCFKLLKSLYGLRTSPRSWWKCLDSFIRSLGFKPCVLEPCLYSKQHNGQLVLISIYVDDILVLSADIDYVKEVKSLFTQRFDMTDMGELQHFLNIHVTRDDEGIHLDQKAYLESVLDKFEYLLGKKYKTRKYPLPDDVTDRLAPDTPDTEPLTEEKRKYINNFPYRSIIGALLYLALHTRPDISYAVGVLSRFGTNPSYAACEMCVYLLQYLRGTVGLGITLSGSSLDLHIYTDADWAGDVLTRRSTTGFVVFAAGGPIAWQSKLQTTVSTSSMQSEYQAMYAGMQEIVWLRGVLGEIGITQCEPTPFFLDSQSAEDLAMNPVYHKRSKHVEIKYHFTREHVDPEGKNTAELIHVSTLEMAADIYTKALTGSLFEKHAETNLGKRKSSSQSARDKAPKSKRSRR